MRRLAALVLALAACAGLGGCGFTPLYGAPGVSAGLTHIQVVAPMGREGFLLREALDDALGHDKGGVPLYRMDLSLAQNRGGHGLTVQNFSQRYEMDMSVTYALTEIATGKVVHTGHVISQISYDAADQPYAGIAARQDIQQQNASDAANKIQLDLSAWMASHAGR